MRIEFKRTPQQVELVKAMGSKDKAKAAEAMQAFAAFISPVVQTVLNQAASSATVYKDLPYNEDDSPSIPLDLYYGTVDNYVTVWMQNIAGGLPSSQVTGLEELKVGEYNLTSAVHWLNKYARKARLDVIAQATNRLTQEILVKQERNAWAVIMKALAEATTNSLAHVITATTAGRLQLDDFNRLMTRQRRIYTSFTNTGTPAGNIAKITDMFLSPEMMEQIRGFAYQPMNTTAVPNTDESTAVPLPDGVRERIFQNAGTPEIYGVGLTELLELGTSRKYNTLFDGFYSGSFAPTTQEILVAIDSRRADAILRPVATNENGGNITVQPDDQWVARSDKSGLWCTVSEGRCCIDARVLTGIIV